MTDPHAPDRRKLDRDLDAGRRERDEAMRLAEEETKQYDLCRCSHSRYWHARDSGYCTTQWCSCKRFVFQERPAP